MTYQFLSQSLHCWFSDFLHLFNRFWVSCLQRQIIFQSKSHELNDSSVKSRSFKVLILKYPQKDQQKQKTSPNPKKGNAKECSNYCKVALISHTINVILKILQARHQQYVNRELPDVQAGFRKGRKTRNQIANICWIIKKAREFQKNIYIALLTMPKPLTVWITTNCGKFLKRWEYQTTLSAS